MRTWQKQHHHHHQHRLTALLVQYAHLTLEQRMEAFERDVLALAETLPKEKAARILDRIADRLKHY
jgi:hypothetical protein